MLNRKIKGTRGASWKLARYAAPQMSFRDQVFSLYHFPLEIPSLPGQKGQAQARLSHASFSLFISLSLLTVLTAPRKKLLGPSKILPSTDSDEGYLLEGREELYLLPFLCPIMLHLSAWKSLSPCHREPTGAEYQLHAEDFRGSISRDWPMPSLAADKTEPLSHGGAVSAAVRSIQTGVAQGRDPQLPQNLATSRLNSLGGCIDTLLGEGLLADEGMQDQGWDDPFLGLRLSSSPLPNQVHLQPLSELELFLSAPEPSYAVVVT